MHRDPVMKKLCAKYPPFKPRPAPLFDALARSVVSQQLSGKAADTIWNRLLGKYPMDPNALYQAKASDLREIGLSWAKAGYINDLSRFALEGGLEDAEKLSDDDLVRHLTQIKGIGVWSCEMVLMFALRRQDIWPIGDLGIRKAAENLYNLTEKRDLLELGERFRPYRSHAAWYMWRSLENR